MILLGSNQILYETPALAGVPHRCHAISLDHQLQADNQRDKVQVPAGPSNHAVPESSLTVMGRTSPELSRRASHWPGDRSVISTRLTRSPGTPDFSVSFTGSAERRLSLRIRTTQA